MSDSNAPSSPAPPARSSPGRVHFGQVRAPGDDGPRTSGGSVDTWSDHREIEFVPRGDRAMVVDQK